jgi:hypothetical protein
MGAVEAALMSKPVIITDYGGLKSTSRRHGLSLAQQDLLDLTTSCSQRTSCGDIPQDRGACCSISGTASKSE